MVFPLEKVPSYTGLYGWFQKFTGRAVRIADDQGVFTYYNKTKLLEALCQQSLSQFRKVDIFHLSRLMIQVLNPVKGLPITIQKVNELFNAFVATEKKATAKELADKFTEFKNRRLKVLTYRPNELIDALKPGDIFFKKNPEGSNNLVVRAQKIFKKLVTSKLTDRESYRYSHAAIYVGDGLVAESVPAHEGGIQVRLVKLEDSRFALSKEHGYEYVVSRAEDQDLRQKAASLAKIIAKQAAPASERQTNNHRHKYAFINAARSLYHSSHFGFFAKQRYFKQYIDAKQNNAPLSFMGAKDFYCSNFVSFCYQTAESQNVIPEKLGVKSEPTKGYTKFGTAIYRGVWARFNRWKNIYALDKHVKMKFDAKWLNPQDFRNFVASNPDIFNDKFLLKSA